MFKPYFTEGTRPHPRLPKSSVQESPHQIEAIHSISRREETTANGTVKTRFLLISDTHAHELLPSDEENFGYRYPLPRADVLLHSGDLTLYGGYSEYKKTFELLKSCEADLKIVIAGNHDLTLDEAYWLHNEGDPGIWSPNKEGKEEMRERAQPRAQAAWDLWTGKEALDAGIIYLEEGTHTFSLKNGAKLSIYTSPFTPVFGNMAFAYPRNLDRFNTPEHSPQQQQSNKFERPSPNVKKDKINQVGPSQPVPNWPSIDVIMTHGPPMYHLDKVNMRGVPTSVGCINHLAALGRARPLLSLFGHIHEGWGAERIDWDLEGGNAVELREANQSGQTESVTGQKTDKSRKWVPGRGTRSINIHLQDANASGHAFIDASKGGREPLVWGKETLLVNAAILTKHGRPWQAPWVVDLDLPVV